MLSSSDISMIVGCVVLEGCLSGHYVINVCLPVKTCFWD